MKHLTILLKGIVGLFLLFLCGQMYAQVYLVSGTNFEAPGYEDETYTGLWNIEHIGLLKPEISVAARFPGPGQSLTNLSTNTCTVKFPDTDADYAAFMTGRYYAVTNNPSKINSALIDNNNAYWGFVMSSFAGCGSYPHSNILRFQVPGLRAGAAVRVEVDYCIASVTAPTADPKLKITFNGNQDPYSDYGASILGSGTEQGTFSPRAPGSCTTIQTLSATGTVNQAVPLSGILDLSISGNTNLSCPIVIKSVRIYSQVDATVSGTNEVCAGGEKNVISVTSSYAGEGITYQWFRDGVRLTGETGRTCIHLTTENMANVNRTYSYYYEMYVPNDKPTAPPFFTEKSATFVAKDILCCMDENGNPTSRKLIWQDDFGVFESATSYWKWDYTDIANPRKVPYPVRHNWQTDVDYVIPGGPGGPLTPALYHPGTVVGPGNFLEGYYTVAANIQSYTGRGADLGWAGVTGNGRTPEQNGWPYFPDHTYGFNAYGACMLININTDPNTTIYKREIKNLCKTTVTVKCFVNAFSSGASCPIRIHVKVTEGTASDGTLTTNTRNSATVSKFPTLADGYEWREATVSLTLETVNSMTFEIVTEAGGACNGTGNDLMLDDIQVFACATPIVELFSDPLDYKAVIKTCKGIGFEMFVEESPMLLNYYGNALSYVYQYNMKDPNDADFKTSWKNINNDPVTANSITDLEYIFTEFKAQLAAAGLEETGSRIYFRVVAGRRAALEVAIAEGRPFNPDDPCKEVSIAEPVVVELDCSCPTPRRVNITANKPISNRVITLCNEETVTLGVSPALLPPSEAYWFESYPGTEVNVPYAGKGLSFNATVSGIPGEVKKYYVRVRDESEPDAVGCYRYDSISIKIDPAPATNILTDVCIAEPDKNNPKATDNICFRFTSNYANGVLNGGVPYESRYIPYRTATGATRIGTEEIVVPASAVNSGDICFAGNQVSVTTGTDPLYHIYLEDVTIVTKTGVLMDGAGADMTQELTVNDNQQASQIHPTRMLLQVTQPVTLKSVTIYVRRPSGTGTITVTPVIYNVGAGNAVGTVRNTLASTTSQALNATVQQVVINLHDQQLPAGNYYLGFTYGTTMGNARLQFGTSPSTNGLFNQQFEDNLAQSVLYGTGSRVTNTNSDRYIIADLKFTTQTAADNCDRVKLTNKYLCPQCDRPDEDAITRKRVDLTVPGSTKIEGDTLVILCNGESVTFNLKPLVFATPNKFDIFWYKAENRASATVSLKPFVNGDTDSWTVRDTDLVPGLINKYYVKVRDKGAPTEENCWIWDSIYVKVNPTPTISVNSPTICKGESATLTASGASTYTWTPATGLSATTGASVTANPTGTTTYTIEGTDGNGCKNTTTATVTVNELPMITVNSPAICKGESATLTASGATTYTWTPATGLSATTGASVTANPTGTTTYTIEGTDGNGCKNTTTATVTVNELPTITVNSAAVCEGLAATLTASGASTYTWSPATGLSATTGATVTANPTGTTTYTIEGTDGNGCKNTTTTTVTINDLPTITVNSPAICKGESATLTASGASTYTWTPATGLSATTGASVTANPTGTTTYTIEGTDGYGCKNTATATVTVNELPTAVITKAPDESVLTCTTPEIDLTASGGLSYSWSNGANTAATKASIPGNYVVTVTDGNGCTNTANVTLTEDKTLPTASITNNTGQTELTCAIQSISLTAVGNGTYSWTNQGGSVVGTSANLTAIAPDTYTLTVTGANGCKNTAVITITQSGNMPTAFVTPNSAILTCATTSILLEASASGGNGSYTYSWAGADTTVTTPGTYTVKVTDDNGCSAQASAVITQNIVKPTLSFNNNNPAICTGGNIALTVSGADTYTWSPATGLNTTSGANVTANPTGTTTYTVTGTTTANGCDNTAQVTVTVNQLPTISVNSPAICKGLSTTLTASGASTYTWTPATGLSATTGTSVTANPTGTTTYTIEGTDGNGCKNTTTATVTVNELPTITVNSPAICNGLSTTLTASGASTYTWSPATRLSATTGTSVTANPTGTITYTIEGTDGNGCKNTTTSTVTVNELPTPGITKNPNTTVLTCETEHISLTATGGTSYSWNTGATTATITSSNAGNYEVTVTDGNGCTAKTNTVLTKDEDAPTAGINNPSAKTELTCETQSITLTATGNGTYSWTNQGGTVVGTTATLTVTIPGTYTVTVKAANACTDAKSITITQNITPPTASINNPSGKTELTCETQSISLTATGGGTYSWAKQGGSVVGTNAALTVTEPGTYIVTVKADNGCTATASTTITENKNPPAAGITNNTGTAVLTCATTNISLTATGNGTYVWNNGLGNNATVTVTTPGTYTVTVTAANGCTATASIPITENKNLPTVGITNNTGTAVLTCATTSMNLTATGGVSYSWDNGLGSNANATVNAPGTHTVTVTAANGCRDAKSITITENKILPTISVDDAEICLGDETALTVSGANSYTWTTGETGSNITVSPAASTTYTVEGTITETGCKNTATIAVYVEAPIGLTLDAPKSIELGNELTITVSVERTDHGYFEWFLNNQPHQTVSEYNLTLRPDAGRHHFLVQTATARLNCPSSSEIYVEVTESVPNIINPYDTNGRNCCFMRGYQVEIYNRYMQKVFEGNDGWDGNYRGAVADPGTYFYRLFKKSGQVEKGTLEVVKF